MSWRICDAGQNVVKLWVDQQIEQEEDGSKVRFRENPSFIKVNSIILCWKR